MIYLDHGATSFPKPPEVRRAMDRAMALCANPGRGGHEAAMAAARQVYRCRETAADLFDCQPEQVVMTMNCTHGLNIAIRSVIRPGGKVAVSGFEHNAVLRPLHALGAEIMVCGRSLFDWEDTLAAFRRALDAGAEAAVFSHVSNVFGCVLPVAELARLCRQRGVPFIVDAAQSAGTLPISLRELGAAFIAMPGHKGLLGPMGTGLLLCREPGEPLLFGGTGNLSRLPKMPPDLPERLEAGTVNVPGIAGLTAGMALVRREGVETIFRREREACDLCARGLARMGFRVFRGPHQGGTVSFLPNMDCEEAARRLAGQGIALRAGLHCAPLAHESAGTLDTGTVRVSFGHNAAKAQSHALLRAAAKVLPRKH